MSPFEHLVVLISIVLGLAITQLLTNVHRLVQLRRRVRLYWLSATWAVLLFISVVEWWWAAFALRTNARWTNFFYFLFVLLSPVALFLAAAFVLPEGDDDAGRQIDLRAYYYENRGAFFTMLALSPAFDAVRRGVEAGHWTDFGAASNAISALLVASLAVSERESWHAVVTTLVGGLFLFFIGSSALQLR